MNRQINLIEKAARIAAAAHSQQKRKVDDSPYVVHPFMVAMKLAGYGFSDKVIAAALVHDVLEDTSFSAEELRRQLGDEVWDIIKIVAEDKKNADLAWEERKQGYIEAVRAGSEESKAVSLADKIHNLENLLANYEKFGPGIWEKFNRGKKEKLWFEEEMLKVFKETWRHPMISEYEELISQERGLSE